VVDVDVDEMVTHLTNMNASLRELLTAHSVNEKTEELQEKLQEAATKIYFQERTYVEDLGDKMMLDAIMAHNHVSVETIGKSAGKWRTLLGQIRSHGYITVLVYPYVASQVLKQRLLARNVQQLRKLRWVQVHPMITAAQNTFVELVPLVDMALMVDNTGKDMHTIVDVVHNEMKCQTKCPVPHDTEMTQQLKHLIRSLCERCTLSTEQKKPKSKAKSRSKSSKNSPRAAGTMRNPCHSTTRLQTISPRLGWSESAAPKLRNLRSPRSATDRHDRRLVHRRLMDSTC
jgi:hypothetical protein